MKRENGLKNNSAPNPPFIIIVLVTFILVLSLTCKNNPIKSEEWQFKLSLEDTACAEVYLKLQIGGEIDNRTVMFKRDDTELWTRKIDATEIEIIDTNLIPGHTYNYTARLISPPPAWIGSSPVSQLQVRTMDSTNHDFTWQTFLFGDGTGGSVINDVEIINDARVYAVGEIHRNDTTFSVAIWNGLIWQLKQLFYNGNNIVVPIHGIFVADTNNVWLAAGGVFRWDGSSSQAQLVFSRLTLPDPNATVEKVWGTSSSFIYGVGNAGTIVFFNGSTWTTLESGTGLDIYDIHSSGDEMLAVASKIGVNFDRRILKIDGATATSISDSPISYSLNGVWFVSGRSYYVAGDGIFKKHKLSEDSWKSTLPYIFTAIRGNSVNDIFTVGIGGRIMHYNGITWINYQDQTGLPSCIYGNLDMKGDLVVAVGDNSNTACIVMGRR